MGTLYDQPIRPGKPAEPRLLYDPLQSDEPLWTPRRSAQVIRLILTHRYNYDADDPYVAASRRLGQGLAGPDPQAAATPQPDEQRPKSRRRLHPLKVFCSSRHALHHVRERGYVERPARVDVILKAIERPARRRATAGPQLRRAADPRRARRRLRQLPRELLHGIAQGRAGLPLRLPDPADRPAAPRPSRAPAITASTPSRR